MEAPKFKTLAVHCIDGDEMCDYIDHKFNLKEYTTKYMLYDYFDIDETNHLIYEMIIEDEEYCNGDDLIHNILDTIAEEFGGHMLVNFLSTTAMMFDCSYIK